jgi:hypothetical protein
MEKAASGNVSNFVDRRLHPVRLSVGLLNRLLEDTKSGTPLNINRELLHSVTSTIELFIEDFEMNCMPPGDAKKGADKADSPRVTQSRVS